MTNANSRVTRYTTLKVLLKNKGVRYSEAAKAIGMSIPSFSSKITGKSTKDFTVEELLLLERAYDLGKEFIFDAVSGRWN